jgi:hypothetical protein
VNIEGKKIFSETEKHEKRIESIKKQMADTYLN